MIDQIRKPVNEEFLKYEKVFKESIDSEQYLLSRIAKHMQSQKGKQIRPILVLLAAGITGKITEDTIYTAVSFEMLHTASLMHDDVVDDTYQRRSRFSVRALWNNKAAILSGDYLISKSASIASKASNRRITSLLAELGCDLSEGELMQLSNESQLTIDEPVYLEVIKKKTANTFAFCTKAGCISVDADEETQKHLYLFGEYLGMIFQMKDDIFDYFDTGNIGKPTSNDLKEGKMTLPLIYALKNAGEKDKKRILNIIRNRDYKKENLNYINNFAKEAGGITYAEKRMEDYKILALDELDFFPESSYKQSFRDCVDYFMLRNY